MSMEIVAHRGASGDAPENTLAAVREAWAQEADAVEVDVRLTSDGQIVVFHDPDTARISEENLVVEQSTLMELRSLDAGCWKAEKWIGERIPSLPDVLAEVPEGKRLYGEIKCGPEVLPELIRILNEPGVNERVVVIGYGFHVLAELKRLHGATNLLQVLRLSHQPKTDQEASTTLEEWIEPVINAGLDGFDLGVTQLLEPSAAENLLARNLKLAAWTVNDPAEARRLLEMGVTTLTTDWPGKLRRELTAVVQAE